MQVKDVSENVDIGLITVSSGNDIDSDSPSYSVGSGDTETTSPIASVDTEEILTALHTTNELLYRQSVVEEFSLALAIAVLVCVIAYKVLSYFTRF